MSALEELVVIAILIALNAIFVAAEIALVTIRRSRVEQLVEEGAAPPGAWSDSCSDLGGSSRSRSYGSRSLGSCRRPSRR